MEFVAVSEDMGIDIAGNWRGFAVGDYDHDEDLDVFVTNQGFHLLMHPHKGEPGRGFPDILKGLFGGYLPEFTSKKRGSKPLKVQIKN
ncbi:MAG: hypothetical protein CM1200mP3_14180 [Chloroflexota bacterium]|nr:MAG: hypothetical protein CM1200mP3_14180 [Chloroflexota bacterium]